MLYTTYFSNIEKIPKDTIILIVSLFLPNNFDCNNINIFHTPELAPDKSDLLLYKTNLDWEDYTRKFTEKMVSNDKSIFLLDKLVYALKHNKNIAFVCYEKDYHHCHRYLLAQHIGTLGIKWVEL